MGNSLFFFVRFTGDCDNARRKVLVDGQPEGFDRTIPYGMTLDVLKFPLMETNLNNLLLLAVNK